MAQPLNKVLGQLQNQWRRPWRLLAAPERRAQKKLVRSEKFRQLIDHSIWLQAIYAGEDGGPTLGIPAWANFIAI